MNKPKQRYWPCEHIVRSKFATGLWKANDGFIPPEWNFCPICGSKRPVKRKTSPNHRCEELTNIKASEPAAETERDTPLTDAEVKGKGKDGIRDGVYVTAEFARSLERKLQQHTQFHTSSQSTPRTDAHYYSVQFGKDEVRHCDYEFARTLERELNTAYAEEEISIQHRMDLIKERDTAKAEIERLKSVLKEISNGIGSTHAANKAKEALQ